MYGFSRPEIVYIKNEKQLDEKFDYNTYNSYYVKTVFGKYQVIDVTHDNKLVTVKASPKTAQERKQKQLSYKKHANCEIIVKEIDLTKNLDLSLFNVFGTQASYNWVSMIQDKLNSSYKTQTNPYSLLNHNFEPKIKDLIFIDRDINMKFKINDIEIDKNILTKNDKQMRLTVLSVEDVYGNNEKITLFDNNIVDSLKDGINYIMVTNAQVNLRVFNHGHEPEPDGLKIPSWAKIELINEKGFPKKDYPVDMFIYNERHQKNE